MVKFLAFLLILCVLFGVEATRSFILGTLGFVFWVVVILFGIYLIWDALRDKRTPEQKEKDAKEKKERKAAEKAYNKFWHEARKKAWFFWFKFIIIATATITAIAIISMYINNPS